MNATLIARVLGILFIVIAIAGLLPWIAPAAPLDAPALALDTQYRILFGFLPVNALSDVAHLLFGLWGIVAGLRFKAAVIYCRSLTWICLVLVILGVIPITNTVFGAVPVYGWNVAFHVLLVLVAAFGGYGRASIQVEAQAPPA